MGGEGTHPYPNAPPADDPYGSDDSTRGPPGPYGYEPTAPYLTGGSTGPYGSQSSTTNADAASFPHPSSDPYGKIQSINRPAAYPAPGSDPYGHHAAYPPAGAYPPQAAHSHAGAAYPPQSAHPPAGAAYPPAGPQYGAAAYPPGPHASAYGYDMNAVAAGVAGLGIAGAGAAHGIHPAGYPPSGYPPAEYPPQGPGYGAPAPQQHYHAASAVPYTPAGYPVGHEGSSHSHSEEHPEKEKKDKGENTPMKDLGAAGLPDEETAFYFLENHETSAANASV